MAERSKLIEKCQNWSKKGQRRPKKVKISRKKTSKLIEKRQKWPNSWSKLVEKNVKTDLKTVEKRSKMAEKKVKMSRKKRQN